MVLAGRLPERRYQRVTVAAPAFSELGRPSERAGRRSERRLFKRDGGDLRAAAGCRVAAGVIRQSQTGHHYHNGFTALQIRLERTGFRDYFDLLVISEQVGVAKPAPKSSTMRWRKWATRSLPRADGGRLTAESDILGGINAGLATCWLNHHGHPRCRKISPRPGRSPR